MYARAGAIEGHLFRLDELSLGTSRFPEGEAAYGYGSLFVDWLARAHGDAEHPALRRRAGGAARSVLARPRGAQRVRHDVRPRVRAVERLGAPQRRGASRSAARLARAHDARLLRHRAALGERHDARLHRQRRARDQRGVSSSRRRGGARGSDVATRASASVPMPGGGFLFAQLDFTQPDVVRSDLYVERDGHVTRLTHGARLIQPDVRATARSSPCSSAPARSTLVRVDALTRRISPLTLGEPEDVYAEPRWSPDGRRIAVAHRSPGGHYAIEVWDLALNARVTLAEGPYLVTSPSWTPDGSAVVYVSEQSGVPAIVIAGGAGSVGRERDRDRVEPSQSGLATPEISRDGRWIAAVELRADGYHLGIAPTATLVTSNERVTLHAATLETERAARERGRLTRATRRGRRSCRATGIRSSSRRRGAARGSARSRRGATSSAGMRTRRTSRSRRPAAFPSPASPTATPVCVVRCYDLAASQNVELQGELSSGGDGPVVGALLKRTRDASLGATYLRPRVRSSASVTVGAGVERRDFLTDPGELLAQLDTVYQRSYTFPRLVRRRGVEQRAASRAQHLAGGRRVARLHRARAVARRRGERHPLDERRRHRGGVQVARPARLRAPRPRAAPRRRHRRPAQRHVARGRRHERHHGRRLSRATRSAKAAARFGVRGFPAASTYGTSAAAGSLEYRAPLVLAARGLGLFPLFLDRSVAHPVRRLRHRRRA